MYDLVSKLEDTIGSAGSFRTESRLSAFLLNFFGFSPFFAYICKFIIWLAAGNTGRKNNEQLSFQNLSHDEVERSNQKKKDGKVNELTWH